MPDRPSSEPLQCSSSHIRSRAKVRGGWLERWERVGFEDHDLSLSPHRRSRPAPAGSGAQRIEVSEFRVPMPGLGRELEGLRIVHLTDIHHGLYFSVEALQAAVELANSLEPDLVALTGDYVSYSRNFAHSAAELLSGLRAPRGVYAVLGNHDFRVGAELVTRALRRNGIEVLRNRHMFLRAGAAELYLAGVDDLWFNSNLPRAMRSIPRGRPVVLLSHNPRIAQAAAHFSVDLVLSGHTHGGQVRLPFLDRMRNGGNASSRRRFHTGWDSLGRTRIYISRGIGTIVVPLRLACPAEMPVFTLSARPLPG